MPLVARASNTVRNKNLLIMLMCLVFLVWFSYDGFVRYPEINDQGVEHLKKMMEAGTLLPPQPNWMPEWQKALDDWPGWSKATTPQRMVMHAIATYSGTLRGGVEAWKKPFDIELQRYIVYGLGAAVLGSVWWLVHCQQRRAMADEQTISPAPGVVIPWGNIRLVDNTRWKKMGIVDITYLDEAGVSHRAKFDDYELDREPLLEILDLMAQRAEAAEFIPKEEPAA